MNGYRRLVALGGLALFGLGLGTTLCAQVPEGAVALSLQDALKTALQKNFDIQVDSVALQQSDWSLKGAHGIYDTQLTFQWYNQINRDPITSSLQVGETRNVYLARQDAYNAGLLQATPWGQTFQFQWDNSKTTNNSAYSILNPNFTSSVQLGTTLPLLQGFGKTVASQTLLQAKLDRTIADSTYLARVRDTLFQVESDYFLLVYAIKDLEVKEKALELAQRFQQETGKKIEVGVLAPIEQVTSDAQVALREQDIITAKQAVADRGDILRLDLGYGRTSPEWATPFYPTDEPQPSSNDKPESELIDQALALRPEMKQASGQIEKDKLALALAKNRKLPQLNLNAYLTYGGATGTLTDPRTGQVIYDRGFSEAWSQITGRDYKSYYIGLAFAYPLQNRAAKAQYQVSRLAQNADEITFEKLKLSIENDVRTSLRDVESAKKRVAAAEVSYRLQKEKLDAEQKKYDNGLSTAFNVLSYQNDLLSAATSLLNARITTQYASAKLERAIGRYLESRGIEIK